MPLSIGLFALQAHSSKTITKSSKKIGFILLFFILSPPYLVCFPLIIHTAAQKPAQQYIDKNFLIVIIPWTNAHVKQRAPKAIRDRICGTVCHRRDADWCVLWYLYGCFSRLLYRCACNPRLDITLCVILSEVKWSRRIFCVPVFRCAGITENPTGITVGAIIDRPPRFGICLRRYCSKPRQISRKDASGEASLQTWFGGGTKDTEDSGQCFALSYLSSVSG
jgi:hypothetical protein